MNGAAPILVVRAKPKDGAAGNIRSWILRTHLTEAKRIPGVTDVTAGSSAAGTWYVLYTFTNAESLQKALGSPEAAYARGTWERWDDQLEERVIEVWAPLVPSSIVVRYN